MQGVTGVNACREPFFKAGRGHSSPYFRLTYSLKGMCYRKATVFNQFHSKRIGIADGYRIYGQHRVFSYESER